MNSISNRLSQTSTSDNTNESQDDFLDEQEQEQLLQDLRRQNEQSNLMIQGGLLFIGILVSAIFLVYLYELNSSTRLTQAVLPFPFLSSPVVSQFKYPQLGILLSIGSVSASMVNLMWTCRVTVTDLVRLTPSQRGMGPFYSSTAITALVLGVIVPLLLTFNSDASWIEVGFWSLPIMMLIMDQLAIHMMRQIEANFTELEKSRYKYKGA